MRFDCELVLLDERFQVLSRTLTLLGRCLAKLDVVCREARKELRKICDRDRGCGVFVDVVLVDRLEAFMNRRFSSQRFDYRGSLCQSALFEMSQGGTHQVHS
jgi:hypothetical protein